MADPRTRKGGSVVELPICRECKKGHHIYCLDDGSSTVVCRCRCGDAPNSEAGNSN
jgi:hypothetical protein